MHTYSIKHEMKYVRLCNFFPTNSKSLSWYKGNDQAQYSALIISSAEWYILTWNFNLEFR